MILSIIINRSHGIQLEAEFLLSFLNSKQNHRNKIHEVSNEKRFLEPYLFQKFREQQDFKSTKKAIFFL